ncbi:MAG: BrnT family toxin [Proteobacteria bacterium]|nr:BrnT family toxin [Pseudomonadota bacterium]
MMKTNQKKAQANLRKDKVSFEEAQAVFSDERALRAPGRRG